MAKISIIIPTLNSEKTLAVALSSISNQTFKNIEILIIDGLSIDDTLKIAEKHRSNCTSLKIISEKDNGIYDAMNKGIGIAKGEWLFFMGSDDTFYSNDVLSNVTKFIETSHAKVIYGDVKIVGNTDWAKDGDIYAGEFTLQKLVNQNICHQAMFYNKQFVKDEVGYFNLAYKKSSDWDFNLKCWAKQPLEYMNMIIANFFAGGFSSYSNDTRLADDFLNNLLQYFRINPFHSLVNNPNFIFYDNVLKMQKENYGFRYSIYQLKRKIIKKLIGK